MCMTAVITTTSPVSCKNELQYVTLSLSLSLVRSLAGACLSVLSALCPLECRVEAWYSPICNGKQGHSMLRPESANTHNQMRH